MPPTPPDSTLTAQFVPDARLLQADPYGSGHINDTWKVYLTTGPRASPYLFQRINERVFPNIPALMENIERVTRHQSRKLDRLPDGFRRCLRLLSTREGRCIWQDESGNWWRAYHFIEGARTYDVVSDPRQAREAARAFGEFQSQLRDLPGPPLHETIRGFHDTPVRLERLRHAVAEDRCGRSVHLGLELQFVEEHAWLAEALPVLAKAGKITLTTTHNDTKINNVMLDDATGSGICVIDLDTVMPGMALHDFGDMVRTAVSPAAEDTPDAGQVAVRPEYFQALVDGYMEGAGSFLLPGDVEHLVLAGEVITFEIGLRFLTDYLEGDTYFKTRRPDHNLDRARSQFALVSRLLEAEPLLEKFLAPYRS